MIYMYENRLISYRTLVIRTHLKSTNLYPQFVMITHLKCMTCNLLQIKLLLLYIVLAKIA